MPGFAPGTHHVTASYVAQPLYASSAGTASVVVTGRNLTLTADSTHPKSGQTVTLTGRQTGTWPSGATLKSWLTTREGSP